MPYNRRYVENSNAPTRHRTLRSGQRRPPSSWEFCKRRVLENFTSSAYKMHLPRQSLVGPALARLNAPFSHESRLFQGYIPASERRPPGGIVARAPLVVVSSVNSCSWFHFIHSRLTDPFYPKHHGVGRPHFTHRPKGSVLLL